VRMLRGSTLSLSTLDFSASACNDQSWDFNNDEHVHLAWQAIRRTQPGLIIGGESHRTSDNREHEMNQLQHSAKHVEALTDMYEHQRRRGMFYLHVHDRKSPTLALSKVRRLENLVDTSKVVNQSTVSYTNCEDVGVILASSGTLKDAEVHAAVASQCKKRKEAKTSWADQADEDLDTMHLELELNQVDEADCS
jgi:hypothetical protein